MEKTNPGKAPYSMGKRAQSNNIIPAQRIGLQPKFGITKYLSPPNNNFFKQFESILKPQHQSYKGMHHNAAQKLWALDNSEVNECSKSCFLNLQIYSSVCIDRTRGYLCSRLAPNPPGPQLNLHPL